MKVGLAIYGDLGTRSGGYLYDGQLVRCLEEHGDQVEVVTIGPGRGLLDSADPRIFRRLKDLDVDVLVEDELCHPSLCLINGRLTKQAAFPMVGMVHHLACRAEVCRGRAHRHLIMERRFLSCVNSFIFNSEATRAAVREIVPDAEGVIARPGKEHVTPRRIERNMGGRLRALYLGNILPHKGLDVLIMALASLPVGTVDLEVIGPAPDHRYLRSVRALIDRFHLNDQVRFHGWLDDRTRDALMDHCHLLAVPSYHEGYGLVFVEAMASGLPVIAPSSGGAREVIAHRVEGFLVDPGDHRAIAMHLQELDRDRGLLEQMSTAARARFETLPTWKVEMERARSHLLSIAGE